MSPHCLGFRMLRGQQRTHICRNGIVFIVFLEFVTGVYLDYFNSAGGIYLDYFSSVKGGVYLDYLNSVRVYIWTILTVQGGIFGPF